MKNCLKTQLKATVDNPNLPILETMQQFTLDAIAASGNASMTDAQKWALNHFFYQIGAIKNTSLWQKIKYLAIPMICNDVVGKALVNYVTNTDATGAVGTFDTHGFICYNEPIGQENYSGNSNNLGFVYLCTKAATVTEYTSLIGIRDSTNGGFAVTSVSDSNYYFSMQSTGASAKYTGDFVGVAILGEETSVTINNIVNGEILTRTFVRERVDAAISNKPGMLSGNFPAGVGIIGYGFTKEEIKNLLAYSMELKANLFA